jgi:hypothetical protein
VVNCLTVIVSRVNTNSELRSHNYLPLLQVKRDQLFANGLYDGKTFVLRFPSTGQPEHRKLKKFRKVLLLKRSWENTAFWVIFWVHTGLNVWWRLWGFRSSLYRLHTREGGESSQNLQESLIRTDTIIACDCSHPI